MHFAVMGFFKPGIDHELPRLQRDFNEHLAQRPIRLLGALRDRSGRRTGFMALLEVEGFAQAEAYLQQSPYFSAGLYERVEVVEYAIEVGRLE